MGRGGLAELDRWTAATARTGPAAPGVVGVEHEFRVLDGERALDFRSLIDAVGVGIGGLDPGDGRARRLDTGAVLTADGREAEIATPPVTVRPGFSDDLLRHGGAALTELAGALGGHRLEGYSTHVSVQVDDRTVVRTARRFVGSFAPSMMLLMDRAGSPGLLVRPRRGRLELCGEHLDGDGLRAATVFATSATARLAVSRPPRQLRVRGRIVPAAERFGWYVDRAAYGVDLYDRGRGALLGGDRSAQDQLEACWSWSRDVALAMVSPAEVALVDDVVAGRAALPLESPPSSLVVPPTANGGTTDAFGSVLRERRRGDLTITARLVTWPFVVLDVVGDGRTIHLGIPGHRLGPVLEQIDRGELDGMLHELLAGAERLPILASVDQTRSVGAYRGVGRLGDLVPGERDPLTGRVGGPNGPGSRRSKERQEQQPRPKPKPKPKALVAAAVVAAVVVAGVAAAVAAGDDPEVVATGGPGPDTVVEPGGEAPDPGDDFDEPSFGPPERPEAPPLTKDPCTLLDPGTVSAYVTAITGGEFPPSTTPVPNQGEPTPTGAPPAPDVKRACHWTFEQVGASTEIPGPPSSVTLVLRRTFSVEPNGEVSDSSCDHFDPTGGGYYTPIDGVGEVATATYPYYGLIACDGHVEISVNFGGTIGDGEGLGRDEARALLLEALENAGDG